METIFIERRGCSVNVDNGRLRITNPKQKMETSFPLTQLRAVVICCDCQLSAALLRNFAKHEIALVCFHPSDIEASFINVPMTHGNIQRRINQFTVKQNPELAARLARFIVRTKMRHQRQLLKKLRQKRSEKRSELTLAIHQFPALPTQGDIPSLIGSEGASARTYFSGLTHVFPPSLGFKGRKKRPAKDQVNALLSFTYTLLTFEAERAIIAAGLDPMLGVLHQSHYNRPSLACDLVEFVRTRADEWVLNVLKTQTLCDTHFTKIESKAFHLNKTGRQVYFSQLMEVMPSWRSFLRKLASRFALKLDQIN